jgi:tRNA(Ile)-lysidine synthase
MNKSLKESIELYCPKSGDRPMPFLGFSGGADSTALALLLHNAKIPFKAVHFNHQLRDSAKRDADFCQEFCLNRNIPFSIIDLDIPKEQEKGETTESTARRLRQQWWQEHAENNIVLVAHHQGDVRENFIIRALRGSSSSGLSGLRREITINKVSYHRPLLSFEKKELINYLDQQNTNWVEDESNREDIYIRNTVRNKILPELANIASLNGFSRCIANVETDATFIENCATNWLQENKFNAKNFLLADRALQPRILRFFLLTNMGQDFIPGHAALERLNEELSKSHKSTIEIPLGQELILKLTSAGDLFPVNEAYQFKWNWRENPEITLPNNQRITAKLNSDGDEHFLINSLEDELTVRSWRPGDRMQPFGKNSQKKIKDLFIDRKAPQQNRDTLPLLINDESIIWVPTIRRAEFGRCTTDKDTVSFSYEKF